MDAALGHRRPIDWRCRLTTNSIISPVSIDDDNEWLSQAKYFQIA